MTALLSKCRTSYGTVDLTTPRTPLKGKGDLVEVDGRCEGTLNKPVHEWVKLQRDQMPSLSDGM